MSLLSMCINLMQKQIIEKVKWAAREIGLTKDDSVQEQVRRKSVMLEEDTMKQPIRGHSPYRRNSESFGIRRYSDDIPGHLR